MAPLGHALLVLANVTRYDELPPPLLSLSLSSIDPVTHFSPSFPPPLSVTIGKGSVYLWSYCIVVFFFLVSWNYFANNYSREWTGLWILERACPLNRCRDVVRRPASVVSFAMFPSFARAFNEFERNTLGNRYFLLGETRRRNELLERRVCFERRKKEREAGKGTS